MTRCLYFACVASLASTLSAQTLVRDINVDPGQEEASSSPRDFAAIGSLTYFQATDEFGAELWVTDGTQAGTARVADIDPGADGSAPENLVELGGDLFFVAARSGTGPELWRSDGTSAGTELVLDILPGPSGSGIGDPVVFNGYLWFGASDGANGAELWRSDGTTAGTEMFLDLESGAAGSFPEDLTVANGTLFFEATTGGNGQLWKTDGTVAGTEEVFDFGSLSPDPLYELTEANGELYFFGYDGVEGFELWKSDGSTAGTVRLTTLDFAGSNEPDQITPVGSMVFFVAFDAPSGREVWVSDGTAPGTQVVSNVSPVAFSSDPSGLTAFNGELFFLATPTLGARKLYRTDGTEAGTELVKDLVFFSSPSNVSVAVGSRIVFSAFEASTGFELWSSDGTTSGTQPLFDVNPGPASGINPPLFVVDDEIFFAGETASDGVELWRSDGTATGTTQVADIHEPVLSEPSNPTALARVGSKLFFFANDGESGREPWVSDGTAEGTTQLGDFNPGPGGSEVSEAIPFAKTEAVTLGDLVVFNVNDSQLGVEIGVSDGTAAGTAVIDVQSGITSSEPSDLTLYDDQVYFLAGSLNRALYRTDGTEAGTQSLVLPANVSFQSALAVFDDRLAIVLEDAGTGRELWLTDGTLGGTTQLADINPGPGGANPSGFSVVGPHLYFNAFSPSFGVQLWRTDGTPAGTIMLPEIYPGSSTVTPPAVDANGQAVFFSRKDNGLLEWSLYASDGNANQLLVPELSPLLDLPRSWISLDTFALLWAEDAGVNGVWRSDGTPGGSTLVKELDGPFSSSFATYRLGSGPKAVFQANDGVFGSEMWVSDGTDLGTQRLTDVAPGAFRAQPENFTRVGDTIFFSADDGERGTELHAVPFALTNDWVAEPFGLGCFSSTGERPHMDAAGAAQIGSSLDVLVEDAPPGQLAILFISPNAQAVPVGGGCTSYVGLPFFTRLALTDANGFAQRSFSIPNDPLLVDVPLTFQWAIGDTAGPFFGTVLSDGLEVILGS